MERGAVVRARGGGLGFLEVFFAADLDLGMDLNAEEKGNGELARRLNIDLKAEDRRSSQSWFFRPRSDMDLEKE